MSASTKTIAMLVGGLLAIGVLSIIIVHQQKDRGFMVRGVDGGDCQVVWADGFPARVVLEDASRVLEPDVISAINFWNKATGFELFHYGGQLIDPSVALDPVIVVQAGNGGLDPDVGDAHLFWATVSRGVCPIRRVVVSLVPSLPASARSRAMAHELGHALGLDHTDREGTLMHPNLRFGGTEITDAERSALGTLTGGAGR